MAAQHRKDATRALSGHYRKTLMIIDAQGLGAPTKPSSWVGRPDSALPVRLNIAPNRLRGNPR